MKQKRYWLRGGIIGLVIVIVNSIFVGPFGLIGYFLIPTRSLLSYFVIIGNPSSPTLLIAYLITGFIYGAIIGLIYGKIKRKNNSI